MNDDDDDDDDDDDNDITFLSRHKIKTSVAAAVTYYKTRSNLLICPRT